MNRDRLKLLVKAERLAETLHEGQVYGDGTPYIGHVRCVVRRVLEDGGDDLDVAVAFLHDTAEDVPEALEILRTELGDLPDGPEVLAAVEALTHKKGQDYHTDYLMGQVFTNERATRVKKADLWCNHKRPGGRDNLKYRRAWAMITAL